MKLPEMELLTKQKQRVLLHSLFLLKSGNYLLIRRIDNGELGQRKRRHRRLLISDGITRQIKACSEKSRPRPYGALYPTTFGVNELNKKCERRIIALLLIFNFFFAATHRS